MNADLYLNNAQVVTDQETFQGGVLITAGKITELIKGDRPVQAGQTIDLGGKLLLAYH